MAVTFDAVGPSAAGQSTNTAGTITWTHTVGAGSNQAVLVGVALGASTTAQDALTCSVTFGGTAMTSLGKIHANNSTFGYAQLFGLTGVAAGAATVTVTATGTPDALIGGSVSYLNVGSFGTAVTSANQATLATVSVTGTSANNMVSGVIAGGHDFTGTPTAGTQRWENNVDTATGASNGLGIDSVSAVGTVTLSENMSASDYYGCVAVEVKAVTNSPLTENDATPNTARALDPAANEQVFVGSIANFATNFPGPGNTMPSFFNGNFGNPTISATEGSISIPCIGSYAGAQPATYWGSLVGSQMYGQVLQVSGTSGTRQTSFVAAIDNNNRVQMMMDGGTFKGRLTVAGANTDVTLATYNATTHAWWRLRESGGTIFYDASPDGLTWTNYASQTHGLNLSKVKPILQAGYYGTETGPLPTIVANFNWTPVNDPSVGVTPRAVGSTDGVAIGVAVTGTGGPPARAAGQADSAAVGVVEADAAGPPARAADALDTFTAASGLNPDLPATARALDSHDGTAIGQGLADANTGAARAEGSTGETLIIGAVIVDAPAWARTLNAPDALIGGATPPDTVGPPAGAWSAPDAAVIDVPEREPSAPSQAQAWGAADLLGIGVVRPDVEFADAARTVPGIPDFAVGGATPEPPFQPVRAVWSPDAAAIQSQATDSVGAPARGLDGTDAPIIDGNTADAALGLVRAYGTHDVTPQVDVALLDVGGIARSVQQNDTWSAWHTTTPSWAVPGAQTFPTASPDLAGVSRLDTYQVDQDTAGNVARAVGPSLGVVVGATRGRLSNLPIMRVLADFTKGPPQQPASTAGGTTVELTQSMAVTAMTVRRGRQYELGKPQAGTAQITVSDPHEWLNPTNGSSPYNSGGASLVSYRPMRVTAVWNGTLYTLYTGYIERYPQTWVDAGFRGIKPLECVDGLAILSNTNVRQSYFDLIVADGATIYIPYDEKAAPARAYVASSKALLADGTALPGNPRQGSSAYYQTQLLVGGTGLRCVDSIAESGTVSYAGDSMPDGTPALSLASTATTTSDTGPRWIARMDTAGGSFNLNTGGSTIECWFRWTEGDAAVCVCESVTDGEFDFVNTANETSPFAGWTTTGGQLYFSFSALGMKTSNYWGAPVSSSFASFTGYPDGQWHYLAITFSTNSGTGHVDMTCTFDDQQTVVGTTETPAFIGINSVHSHATSFYGDPSSKVSVAQFAYYQTPLTQAQRLAHFQRGAGNLNEHSTDRFTRLMNTYWGGASAIAVTTTDHHNELLDADFIYGVYPSPGMDTTQAVQPYTVLQAQQMIDVAEQGLTYFDRSGVATFEPRNTRLAVTTSLATFGDLSPELPYTVLEYDYDPQYVYTQTQITKVSGGQQITNDDLTAQANFGVRSYTDQIQLYNEFDLFQFGMQLLALYSTQRVRIRRIELDPGAVGSDALWKVVLGLELSQRFTVNRRTANGSLYSHDFYVEQIEHVIDAASSKWTVRLQLSPVLYAQNVGHVDVAGQSTLGSQTVVSY